MAPLALAGGLVLLKREDIERVFIPDPVSIDAAALKAEGEHQDTTWVQIGLSGIWKGRTIDKAARKPLTLGLSDFEEMRKNFRARLIETVVDYEHQTLTGQEAPAAGWAIDYAIRDTAQGPAPFVLVAWNARAAAAIRAKEYRYVSPVILWGVPDRRTAKPMGAFLHSIALTNTPFLEELPGIALSLLDAGAEPTKEQDMEELIAALAAKLELPKDASREQVEKAVGDTVALCNERGANIVELYARLDLAGDASPAAAAAAIASLKHPVGMVQADRLVEAEQTIAKLRAEGLMEAALKDGKIAADEETVACYRKLAEENPEQFEAMMKLPSRSGPPMTPVAKPPRSTQAGADLTEGELAVCKNLGLTAEQFRKHNPVEG